MEYEGKPAEKDVWSDSVPDGHRLLRHETVNGLYTRVVKTEDRNYFVFTEDQTPDSRFMLEIAQLHPTTRLYGNRRVWFCGPYNGITREKQKPKRAKKSLIKKLKKLRASKTSPKVERHVTNISFEKLLPGKQLSDLHVNLHVVKQSAKSVVVYGEAAASCETILARYGKKRDGTRVGEGWLMSYDQYCVLKKEF